LRPLQFAKSPTKSFPREVSNGRLPSVVCFLGLCTVLLLWVNTILLFSSLYELVKPSKKLFFKKQSPWLAPPLWLLAVYARVDSIFPILEDGLFFLLLISNSSSPLSSSYIDSWISLLDLESLYSRSLLFCMLLKLWWCWILSLWWLGPGKKGSSLKFDGLLVFPASFPLFFNPLLSSKLLFGSFSFFL